MRHIKKNLGGSCSSGRYSSPYMPHRWTPLLHMTMCVAPRREQSSEATVSSPAPEAPQAVNWQAAVRRQLIKLSIRR